MTPPPEVGRPLSVLIVDDCPDTVSSTAALLLIAGYSVRVAAGGPGALRAVADDPPDAVLIDIRMPGMDGWELARRIRRLPGGERLFLVALTGLGRDEDRMRSDDAWIDLHLVKPVDPAALVGVLEQNGHPSVAAAEPSYPA